MFFRILKLDLKKRKGTNLLLLLFIILATIFSASGLNNVTSVMNGTDYYFDKAEIGDYVVVANSNNNIKEILDNEKSVQEYKIEPCIFALKNNLKHDSESLDTGSNVIFQSIEDSKMKFFDKDDNEITSVKKGEVYLSGRVIEKSDLSVGDEVTIDLGDTKFNLTIAGKSKDAFFGTDFIGITRVLLNEEDYKKVYDSIYDEENKGYEIYYVKSNDVQKVEQSLGDASSVIFKGSKDVLKITYVMDMIISFALLALSVCLIVVALLILKFTITFTINEEYREIGVMKAIGLKNRRIRNIYIVKYLCLGIVGSFIGLFLSIPFGDMLTKATTSNMVLGSSDGVGISVIGALFVVLITVLFAYIYTGKVKKSSPVDAIRNGQTGERYKSKTLYKLKNSRLRLNLYMALNDILSAPKKFITIIVSFFVCVVLVLSLVITTDTMKSKNLITAFSTESDVYFMPGNIDIFDTSNAQSKERYEQIIMNYEKLFSENGMPSIVRLELQFNGNIIHDENTYNIKVMQGLNTVEDKYVYTDGIAPVKDNELAVTDVISKKIGAKIGDRIKLDDGTGEREFIITAYFQSLYNLGEVIRLNNNTLYNYENLTVIQGFQVDFTDSPSEEEIENRIEKIKKLVDSDEVYDAAGICVKNLSVVPTMEAVQYMLLGITIVVIVLVTLLMELSFVTNEKSQIALLKALGFKNGQIIKWHMYRFLIVAIIAEVLAALLAIPVTKLWCNQVFGMMGAKDVNYFINPIHVYLIYPVIVFAATIIISAIAALVTNRIKSSDTASIE